MAIKVKLITDLAGGYGKEGDVGKIIDEWKEKGTERRIRAILFKSGNYAVFGDTAFDRFIKIIK